MSLTFFKEFSLVEIKSEFDSLTKTIGVFYYFKLLFKSSSSSQNIEYNCSPRERDKLL